jgi:hypothetical protein
MAASKGSVTLPDFEVSIALAQAARQELEREFLADRHAVDQMVGPGKRGRAGFPAVLQECLAAVLKSTFQTAAGVTASFRSDDSMAALGHDRQNSW